MTHSDRHPDIWPRVDLTNEPDEEGKTLEAFIKAATEGEPIEVRGVDVADIGWLVFDGKTFVPHTSDMAGGHDEPPVPADPAARLTADGDTVQKGAGRHWIEENVQWHVPECRLDDDVQTIRFVPEGKGPNIGDIDEGGRHEPWRNHVLHVAGPKVDVGLRVGWRWVGHLLSLLRFRRASVARPADDSPISPKKDAA